MMNAAFNPLTTPYEVDELDYPRVGSMEEQIAFLLRYVILAPSTHNTQPWRFAVSQEGVEIFADYTRRMPVVDPDNRELLMSVGAAVMNLRVAAAHFGFLCHVNYNLSGDSESPVAFVQIAPAGPGEMTDRNNAELLPWITRRHTNRSPFLISRVPRGVLDQLVSLQANSRASLHISLDGSVNDRVGELVEAAGRQRLADPGFRRDVAEWVRPAYTQKPDGIPGDALGMHGIAAALGQWATRTLDRGKLRAAKERNLCVKAPGLITIACEDAVPHWLDAGELLEAVLLTLAREGLSVSYFNMPIQVPDLRARLRALLGCSAWPQLLLRVGFSLTQPVVTPRRALQEMLTDPRVTH